MRFLTALLLLLTLVVAGVGASAQEISNARVNNNCTTFLFKVGGEHLSAPAYVRYVINVKPATGPAVSISDKIQVRPDKNGEFNSSFTKQWSDYKLNLNDTYTFSGTASLSVGESKRVPIIFAQTTLTCKVSSNACLPTSSLSILTQGSNVTSYVPNGAWATSNTGIRIVPIEVSGAKAQVSTGSVVNSCSSNSTTGTTVCVANDQNVYLLNGSTISNTLTSGADTYTYFSGGSCMNCGVAINNLTNTALLTIGMSTSASTTGIQFLDLATNNFQTPVASQYQVSEDVVWDQNRNLLLSPSESGNYDMFQTSPSLAEYTNASIGQILDSAAEDCTTGVALSAVEFTDQLFITDASQAKFTSGAPGSWSGPWQFQTFPEFAGFAAGTSGIAVAPGTHLSIVTGEFGGNQFGALQLPSTSGAGTPGVVDYAAAALPNTPDGNPWNQGLDPHTISAYQSPADGKAYAVLANGGDGLPPTYLAILDLQAVLNAPRLAGTHTVDPSYDLAANKVLRYVSTN
jgi:hypothetical protein